MPTLHRRRHRVTVWISLIAVLLLSACGAPAPGTAAPGTGSAPSAQPSSQPSPSPSPAPSTAPASPTTEQPNPQPSAPAGEQPGSTAPDTYEPTEGAFYLFPDVLPDGLEVRPAGASADASGFSLNLGRVGQRDSAATIVGGTSSAASQRPTDAGQMAEITVRTVKATAYDRGSGYSIFWEEQGIPYAIIGDLTLDEARAVAEGLQSTDLEGWQMKLAEVGR